MDNIEKILERLGGRAKLLKSLNANLTWLINSFDHNKNKGSSGTRTLRGKWGDVYPETTGYLVPTLYRLGELLDRKDACELALSQLEFFKSIQNEDGSFFQATDNDQPIIFDTAQILEGLLFIAHTCKDPKPILKMIILAVDWLGLQLDAEGVFTDYNYVENYNPAYYARVAWLMASAELIKYSKPRTKTKALIKRIATLQNKNKTFSDWSLHPNQPANTHTIAYTLRGLMECTDITHDRKIRRTFLASAKKMRDVILESGIAGAYDQEWNGDYDFQCATGNAQLAILYTKLYRRSGDKLYLGTIVPLLLPLIKSQRKRFIHKGAIPSSIPISGPYQRYKYTNWTQKFYCDAILELFSGIGRD